MFSAPGCPPSRGSLPFAPLTVVSFPGSLCGPGMGVGAVVSAKPLGLGSGTGAGPPPSWNSRARPTYLWNQVVFMYFTL